MDSLGLPIYSGYYIEDLRDVRLGRWEERGCDAAFIQLEGQQGITETRVSEVPPRGVLPPVRLAFDEVVYVVQGRGATTVWRSGSERKSFEWSENSMFLLPRHHFHQFSNTHGSRPARLLHYNYFPLLLSASPDPEAFISTNRGEAGEPVRELDLEALYAEPALKTTDTEDVSWKRRASVWIGSFFPDMSAWDKLTVNEGRGAGGRTVAMEFPRSEISCHMSMFPSRTYKKAHRHGAGAGIDGGFFGGVASSARGERFEMVAHELRCAVGLVGGDGGVELAVRLARRVGHVGLLGVQRVEGLLDEWPRSAEHGQQG